MEATTQMEGLMDDIKERLRLFIKENGGNASEIARQIGVHPNHFGTLLSSDKGLSATIIIGFAKAGYDVQSLLTGESDRNRIAELEEELRDANTLIDSLERILKS